MTYYRPLPGLAPVAAARWPSGWSGGTPARVGDIRRLGGDGLRAYPIFITGSGHKGTGGQDLRLSSCSAPWFAG